MYKKPVCTGFGPDVCYECCRQARIPSVPYTAFPPGLVLEAEPNWELGYAFPLKKKSWTGAQILVLNRPQNLAGLKQGNG